MTRAENVLARKDSLLAEIIDKGHASCTQVSVLERRIETRIARKLFDEFRMRTDRLTWTTTEKFSGS